MNLIRKSLGLVLFSSLAIVSRASDVTSIAPLNVLSGGWSTYGLSGGGAASLGGPSLDGDGALQMNGDRARVGLGVQDGGTSFGVNLGTLGALAAGGMSYDFIRYTSSTANANQFFAVKLFFANGDSLTWENAYQDSPITTTGTWFDDYQIGGATGKWWYRDRAGNVNYTQGGQYLTLGQFANGQTVTNGTSTSAPLSSSTAIMGVSFALGSGIPGGTFTGAVDDLTMSFKDGANYRFNFAAQPVPEPASLAAVGFGAFAVIRRRKKA